MLRQARFSSGCAEEEVSTILWELGVRTVSTEYSVENVKTCLGIYLFSEIDADRKFRIEYSYLRALNVITEGLLY